MDPLKAEGSGRRRRKASKQPALALGWREWAALPEFGVGAIKVKLDTGARTSSLHAFDMKRFQRGGVEMVQFEIHPEQRSRKERVHVEAEVMEERWVRNSGGERELRPVVETDVRIGDEVWPIELTLTRRDEMGFRMLLGRQALRKRAVVDPGSSYRAGRRMKKANR
ncbi:MAG: ATP-dependent zinc protease [Gemmatimonadetes bacterium]|nr:ATP-dependent zinc protease [Gemmatimonadota bacterium]NNL29927.1 ATP-dependent zinc protease [Gemmatimonadota bacterium]